MQKGSLLARLQIATCRLAICDDKLSRLLLLIFIEDSYSDIVQITHKLRVILYCLDIVIDYNVYSVSKHKTEFFKRKEQNISNNKLI